MNDFIKNMAQALFNQDKINDLLRKELQQAVNDLLEAELTAFLGYDPYARAGWNTGNSRNGAYFRKVDTQFGEIEIQVPRDRNGMFHQHTLPDYKQHSNVLESMIIKLYSKGVTTREIADLIEKMYGSHYSLAQVSNISKQMIPKVDAYHQRKRRELNENASRHEVSRSRTGLALSFRWRYGHEDSAGADLSESSFSTPSSSCHAQYLR